MSIIDGFPSPFQKPTAQELMRIMARFYRTEREAVLFTQPFGIDPFPLPRRASVKSILISHWLRVHR